MTLPSAASAPMTARRSVVFPAPLRPISPHISPSFTASEASRMIGIGPIETWRPSTLSMGASGGLHPDAGDQLLHARLAERLGRRAVGDDGAVVEGEHALRELSHDLHVVLDEQHGDLAALERR